MPRAETHLVERKFTGLSGTLAGRLAIDKQLQVFRRTRGRNSQPMKRVKAEGFVQQIVYAAEATAFDVHRIEFGLRASGLIDVEAREIIVLAGSVGGKESAKAAAVGMRRRH